MLEPLDRLEARWTSAVTSSIVTIAPTTDPGARSPLLARFGAAPPLWNGLHRATRCDPRCVEGGDGHPLVAVERIEQHRVEHGAVLVAGRVAPLRDHDGDRPTGRARRAPNDCGTPCARVDRRPRCRSAGEHRRATGTGPATLRSRSGRPRRRRGSAPARRCPPARDRRCDSHPSARSPATRRRRWAIEIAPCSGRRTSGPTGPCPTTRACRAGPRGGCARPG